MTTDRLERQIAFPMELDKLKTVFRRSYLASDPNRKENDAEHMWHSTIAALVVQEYAPAEINVNRVIRLMLVHDVVEIDAGDVSVYLRSGIPDLADREKQAARRIFGLLPEDQAAEMRQLWEEFEAAQTPEACFARAIDRLIPLLLNYHTRGKTWQDVPVTYDQVIASNRKALEAVPPLWEYLRRIIDDSLARGYLKKE